MGDGVHAGVVPASQEIVVTKKKNLKKRIRDRQQKTGESYMTARRHVIGGDGSVRYRIPRGIEIWNGEERAIEGELDGEAITIWFDTFCEDYATEHELVELRKLTRAPIRMWPAH